jgi:hypothetical protein
MASKASVSLRNSILPEGMYLVTIDSVEDKKTKSGLDAYNWTFLVTRPMDTSEIDPATVVGTKLFALTVREGNTFMLSNLLSALGEDIDTLTEVDPDSYVGLNVVVQITHNTWLDDKTGQTNTSARIKKFFPANVGDM